MVVITLLIDSVDRSTKLIDSNLSQSCTYYTQRASLKLLDDASLTLKNSVDNYSDIQLKYDGVLKFRGVVLELDQGNNKEMSLKMIDYSYLLADKIISVLSSEVQTAEGSTTAKDYIKYILDTYFSTAFNYTLQETVTEYTRDFKGRSALSIIREFTILEDFVFKIEPQTTTAQKVLFQPETHEDLDITLSEGLEIYSYSFPKTGSKVKNVITVAGKSGSPESEGIVITRRNSESIIAYGARELRVVDTSITSIDQAIDRADFELKKRAFPLQTGKLTIKRDTDIVAGGIVYLNISDESFTLQPALVLNVNFSFPQPIAVLEVSAITTNVSEIMAEIVDIQRLSEERFVDDDTPIKSVEIYTELMTIACTFSVERRDSTGGIIGKAVIGTIKIGSLPTATFAETKAEQSAKAVNVGITALLRLMGQLTPSNALDGTYSYCALGTDSTPPTLTDTTLGSELVRVQVESGFPSSAANETTWEFIITDSDLLANTSIYELGLFDASSSGNLICRLVFDTPLNKSAGEELKFIFKLSFSGIHISATAEKELRDMLTSLSTDYIDASNSSIELLGDVNDRKALDASYPVLKGGSLNILEHQSTFDIPDDIAAGNTEDQIKLFNELAAGVTILDVAIADLITVSQQDIIVKTQIKVVNSDL